MIAYSRNLIQKGYAGYYQKNEQIEELKVLLNAEQMQFVGFIEQK